MSWLTTAARRPAASRPVALVAAVAISATALSACSAAGSATSGGTGLIRIVAGQNEYGNVASQIGGRYVRVTSVESNPNTDPHTYEVSPGVANEVSAARLVIQNGVGYDDFMNRIEAASPDPGRTVIDVQKLLGLPDDTPNPHLWYDPRTMPVVARRLATDLSAIQPSHATYFHANATTFVNSLNPWLTAISSFRATYGGTTAATTEPVADDLLQAMAIDNLTPFQFQADIMNGTDPSPQDITLENGFFTSHRVSVFCYNQQVVDALTTSIRHTAQTGGVPVVGFYETMPAPGYDYQTWMVAEVTAIRDAVAHGVSTEHL